MFKIGDKIRFIDEKSNYLYWERYFKKVYKDFRDVMVVSGVRLTTPKPYVMVEGIDVGAFTYRLEKVIEKGQMELPFKIINRINLSEN